MWNLEKDTVVLLVKITIFPIWVVYDYFLPCLLLPSAFVTTFLILGSSQPHLDFLLCQLLPILRFRNFWIIPLARCSSSLHFSAVHSPPFAFGVIWFLECTLFEAITNPYWFDLWNPSSLVPSNIIFSGVMLIMSHLNRWDAPFWLWDTCV